MIIETELISPPQTEPSRATPRINPNIVFLGVFLLGISVLTPFVVKAINVKTPLALVSPLIEDNGLPITDTQSIPVTVAAPATGSATNQANTATTESNSTSNVFVLPAGLSEFEVINPKISGSSYIYLIPVTKTNSVVSVKSKSAGKFTVAISPSENIDLTVDYLLINQ